MQELTTQQFLDRVKEDIDTINHEAEVRGYIDPLDKRELEVLINVKESLEYIIKLEEE